MRKKFLALLTAVSLIVPCVSAGPAAAGVKKEKQTALQRDLAFYRRQAKAKNMGANDRLYILYRLKDKHAEKGEDLSPLLKEIARWEEVKRSGRDPGAPKAVPRKAKARKAARAGPASSTVVRNTPAGSPAGAASPAAGFRAPVPAPAVPDGTSDVVEARSVDMDYVLQVGDVLTVRVSPSKGLNRETVIHPDGTLLFPLVGAVRAQGLTQGALEKLLQGKLRSFVNSPRVRVSVLQITNNKVFVMGRVAVPGIVAFRPDMRVLSAVTAAGGFQEDAERSRVLIYRGQGVNRKTLTFDTRAALMTRDPAKDFPLQPGDIVDVPSGGNNLSILGMVARPGSFPWKDGTTLLELVSKAGGFSPGAKTGKVFIYRQSESGRKAEEVNVNRIMDKNPEEDPVLKPGDMVMVPQNPFYASTGAVNNYVTPWATIAALVVAIVVATK